MALDEKLLVGGSRKDCVGYSDASNGFNVLQELPPPPPITLVKSNQTSKLLELRKKLDKGSSLSLSLAAQHVLFNPLLNCWNIELSGDIGKT